MKLDPSVTLKELAALIGATYEGPDLFAVTGINEIHRVVEGDVTFVDHPKYYTKALRSNASVVIINKQVECPAGKALVFSQDPFADYNKLVEHFSPFRPCHRMISDSAVIGEGTVLQPGVFIGNNVSIGKNCLIHAHVSIYDNSVIGDHVIVHANTVIGADAFYFQKRKEGMSKMISCGRVVIGNHVEIGACCTIDKGVSSDTTIGDHTKLDNHIQIGHDTVVGKNCIFASAVVIAGVTTIEDDVILWGQVAVNKDLTIKKGAIVLATSSVGNNLEGGKVYFGAPAIEARRKWKEMAIVKKLPELLEKIQL